MKIKNFNFKIKLKNDEKDLLTISANLNLQWNDSNLQWNPNDFGNLKAVRLSIYNIWLPGRKFRLINQKNQKKKSRNVNSNKFSKKLKFY